MVTKFAQRSNRFEFCLIKNIFSELLYNRYSALKNQIQKGINLTYDVSRDSKNVIMQIVITFLFSNDKADPPCWKIALEVPTKSD